MKNIIIAAIIVIVIIIGFFLFSDNQPIGESIHITSFEVEGENTGTALVRIPFLKALEGTRVSVALDTNNNGTIDESETVVENVPTNTRTDWNSGFYFPAPQDVTSITHGSVTVDGETFAVAVTHATQELGDLIDLASITNPEEAMKGLGAVAYAQDVEISYDSVPDINQRRGECAPTAAANSLIDLVDRNDGEDLGDPTELIDELKEHMNWTAENGVLPDDFVRGKNAWAAANNLPIETSKLGDANGVSTIEAIREALENGDAVELRIKFANNQLQGVGGHMVTVTGIHVDGNETYLEISDPYTVDSGTETVRINSNQITDYGPWNQITVLSWGFVQTWTGTENVQDSSTTVEEPAPENTAGSGSVVEPQNVTLEATFAHVKPGEYSEVYTVVTGLMPGTEVNAKMFNEWSPNGVPQVVEADRNGVAHFTWRITQYGTYNINVTTTGGGYTGGATVTVN